MILHSYQVPCFPQSPPLSPVAVEVAFAEMHDLGLRIDGGAPAPRPRFRPMETARLVAQVTEQLEALDHQRKKLTTLLEEIA